MDDTTVQCHIKSNFISTPLHKAVEQNKEEEVLSLLENGENVNCRDETGSSPLHTAVQNNSLQIIHHLLNYKPNIDITDFSLKTPLHIAAEKGHIEITKILLHHGANIGSQDEYLSTPLHTATIYDQEIIVQILLQHHADVNIKAWDNKTPLLYAVSMNRTNLATLLLKNGANIEDKTINGCTPLHLAVDKRFLDIAQVLLQSGACINTRNVVGSTPLIRAIEKNDHELINFLIENNADLGFQSFIGSPLHHAVKGGILDLVKYLLDIGADVNSVSSYNDSTPLHWAVKIHDCNLVKFLLENKADVNLQMKCRFTSKYYSPLALAIKYRKFNLIEILLKHVFLLRQNEIIKKATRRYRSTTEESGCNRSKISSQNILYLNRFMVALEKRFNAKKLLLESNLSTMNIDHMCILVRGYKRINDFLQYEKTERWQEGVNFFTYIYFLFERRVQCIKLWPMSFEFFHFILTIVLRLSDEESQIIETYFVNKRNTSYS